MVNGKEEPYLSAYCKKYVIDCKVIQVNYNKYNGTYKISDAYVIIDNHQIMSFLSNLTCLNAY